PAQQPTRPAATIVFGLSAAVCGLYFECDFRSERDDFSSNRHLALRCWWSMIPRVEPEGMLFRKPASTPDQVRGRLFRDHPLADAAHPVRLEAGNGGLLRIDHAKILDDLELPVAGLGDVHVHASMMLAGHHLGQPAGTLGDLGVLKRLDDVVLIER